MRTKPVFLVALAVFMAAQVVVPADGVIVGKVENSNVVLDFESDKGFAVSQGPLEAEIRSGMLEIKSTARGGYPNVALRPASGSWDLGGYDAVLMDIQNLDDKPVRVLLSLNNDKADGRKHCNTESVVVPAKSKGILTVPYGMWHGSTGNNIDRSAIVSILVMLDQPGQDHHFAVDNIRTVTYEKTSMEDLYAASFYKKLKPFFEKGINLGNALEAPKEGGWGVTLQEHYFKVIAEAGFNHVRVPCRWSAHAAAEPPYKVDDDFFKRVDWVLENAFRNKLKVVLNMHHYDEYFDDVKGHDARFLAIWGQVAQRYSKYPDDLCFELLNEPHGQMSPAEWNRIAADAISEIRKTNPKRWIMVGPGSWNSIKKLNELELPENDRRLVVTVHYYSPFQFTHQGATWAGESVRNLKNIRWQGAEEERNEVRNDFDSAIAWAVMHERPLYLGEFGAYSPAPFDDRVLWTSCIAEEAAKRNMGYAYWEFCAGFGAYDPKKEEWRQPLLRAILMRKP